MKINALGIISVMYAAFMIAITWFAQPTLTIVDVMYQPALNVSEDDRPGYLVADFVS